MFNKPYNTRKVRRYDPLWLLLVLDLILALVIMGINGYNWQNTSSRVMGQSIKALAQGHFGSGIPSGRGNDLDLSVIQPGDILLGGYDGATYGKFTHAAIYEGEGIAWQGWLSSGVSRVRIERFLDYDRACILRVNTDSENRRQAVEMVAGWDGQLFYPLVFKPGDRVWNCTKIIWEAYRRLGLDLDAGDDLWITPDNIYRSPRVSVIAQSGDL